MNQHPPDNAATAAPLHPAEEDMAESKLDPLRWVMPALAIFSVVAGLGGYAVISSTQSNQIAANARTIETVRAQLDAHERLEGHPVDHRRIEQLERDRDASVAQLIRFGDQLGRIEKNVAIMCAASPGRSSQCEH